MRLSSEALRMARAGLGWEQKELAERSGVSVDVIKRLERDAEARTSDESLDRLGDCLEKAGVMVERSFKRGLVVSLTKTAEARRRIVAALSSSGDSTAATRKAISIVREYRDLASTYYEYDEQNRPYKVAEWLDLLRKTLTDEASYQGGRDEGLATRLTDLAISCWPYEDGVD